MSSWHPNYNAGIFLMVQTEWKNAQTEGKQALGRCTAISYLSHEQMGLLNLPSSKCYLTVQTSELSLSFPCLARQMKHRNFITHLLLAGKQSKIHDKTPNTLLFDGSVRMRSLAIKLIHPS